MERYPEHTTATIDSFRNSGWKKALAGGDREGYSSMWQSLSTAARTAIENGLLSEGKSLWLLADACSMMLNPSSSNEPFKPFMIMDGRRSSLPIDFQRSDVELFSAFAEEVDDPWLQARLADLVWLLIEPRSPKHALLAIDAYASINSIEVGEVVEFSSRTRTVLAKVTDIRRYSSFDDLLNNESASRIVPGESRESLLKILRDIYPPFKEKLGVVALQVAVQPN